MFSEPSGDLPDAEAGAGAGLCSTEAMPTGALLVDAGDAAAAVWDARLGPEDCNTIPEDGVAVPGLAVLSKDVTSEALWERRPLAALPASMEGVRTPSMDPLRAAALFTVTGAFPCKAHESSAFEHRSTRHDLVHDLMQLLVSSRQPSRYRLRLLPVVELAEAAQRCIMGATAWRWVSWATMCVVHDSSLPS